MPGVTHERAITCQTSVQAVEESPDGCFVAVAVLVEEYHMPNSLGQIPDGGIRLYTKATSEILVCNLQKKSLPMRLVSLKRQPEDRSLHVCWDSTGILVSGQEPRGSVARIDLATCEVLPLSGDELARARTTMASNPGSSIGGGDLRRRHVRERYDQFFLWDPIIRRDEYLFDLPLIWDGLVAPIPTYVADGRRRQRTDDAILRIWDSSIHQERDSVRVSLNTYAPRPGTATRSYLLETSVWAPDTVKFWRNVMDGVRLPLATTTRTLGPLTTRVDVLVAYADLRRILVPFGGYLCEWPRDSLTVSIQVDFAPLPAPDDSIPATSPVYRRSYESAAVNVPIRRSFFLPRRVKPTS